MKLHTRIPFFTPKEQKELQKIKREDTRPGIWRKVLHFEDYMIIESSGQCQDCGKYDEKYFNYMVRDEIWKSVADEGLICILCFEERLGRKIHTSDLKWDDTIYYCLNRIEND